MPIDLQIGYTSPMVREDRFAKAEPKRKRNPIGSVHFGEPEAEARTYLDEYLEAIEFDDELLVGFTAPLNQDVI